MGANAGGTGAGGAGGGEYSSGNFIAGSAGGGGYAAVIRVKILDSYSTDKLWVKVSNNNYKIHSFKKPSWDDGTVKYEISKLSIDTQLSSSRTKSNRTYSLSPFTVGSSLDYIEFQDASGFKDTIKLVNSKAYHDNIPLKVIYTTNNVSSVSYIAEITVDDYYNSSVVYNASSSNSWRQWFYKDSIYYVLLQAGGGGGGGADSSYGLFNYAEGGGGGAAGGACVLKIQPKIDYEYAWINIGAAGGAGTNGNQGTAGTKGSDTTLRIYSDSSQQTEVVSMAVWGGGGGAGGNASGGYIAPGGSKGQTGTLTDTAGIVTRVCIIDGGDGGAGWDGGKGGGDGGTPAANWYITSESINTGLFNALFTLSQSTGSGGTTGGLDDRGGGGGASWLGDGGNYT